MLNLPHVGLLVKPGGSISATVQDRGIRTGKVSAEFAAINLAEEYLNLDYEIFEHSRDFYEEYLAPSAWLKSKIDNATGEVIPINRWRCIRARRRELVSQSFEIAAELERAGVDTVAQNKVNQIGLYSGDMAERPRLRKLNILPYHAAINRAKILRNLEYYIETNRCFGVRMFVVTSGDRCPYNDVRERFNYLNRLTSRMNAQLWFSEYFEILLRSNELGGLKDDQGELKRDDQGRITYHAHSHLIVEQKKFIPEKEYREIWHKIKSVYCCCVHDAGRLRNVREAVKYVAKPQELIAAKEDLHGLHLELFRANLVQPMGRFREMNRRLADSCLLVERPDKFNCWQWREIPSPYKKRKQSPALSLLSPDELASVLENRWFRPQSRSQAAADALKRLNPGKEEAINVILSVSAPLPFLGRLMEPVISVANYTGNLDAIRNDPRVKGYYDAGIDGWLAGKALLAAENGDFPMDVHKTPLTVGAFPIKKPEKNKFSGSSDPPQGGLVDSLTSLN